jgi:hypothetical protein
VFNNQAMISSLQESKRRQLNQLCGPIADENLFVPDIQPLGQCAS